MNNKKAMEEFLEVSQAFTAVVEKFGKSPEMLQICYEAIAWQLGYLEGTCCLGGVPREPRIISKAKFFQSGKEFCLENHRSKHCKKKLCDGAKCLKDEMTGSSTN